MSVALDASALLAWLHEEPGAQCVDRVLHESRVSTVNWAEVVQRVTVRGLPVEGLRRDVEALGVELVPFDVRMAEVVGMLHARTRSIGLSLGDRACLALAQTLGLTALTADRAWTAIDLQVPVELIR